MISKNEKEAIRKDYVDNLWRQGGFDGMDKINQKMLKIHLETFSLDYANTKEQVLERLNSYCMGYYMCYYCIKEGD